jgi:hypothetical protein
MRSLATFCAAIAIALPHLAHAGLYDDAGDLAEACRVATDERRVAESSLFGSVLFVGCMGYVNGFWHGSATQKEAGRRVICWSTGITPTDIARIFVRFIDANPQLRNEGPFHPMHQAMRQAFPCK